MLANNDILQDRYRILRQLGRGGMGAVYEAKDERLGSLVALKEILIEKDKFPTGKQREVLRRAFEREARLLANLHHEVFPRVMDYFSEENRQILIMELVFGDDLGERLGRNDASFEVEACFQWADHLLDALDYLHTTNPPIFHRDIKPQNLKVTSRGKIKLLDFGIAKSVDQTAPTLANQTFVAATLDYAPIEQILPAITPTFREFIVLKHEERANAVLNQNTDARCDLYAVGATFYHLLTGRAPIDSAKRTLEVWEGNHDPLPNPCELNPDLAPTVSAWLLKALQIDRADRFSTAIEMQNALRTAIVPASQSSPSFEKQLVLSEPPPAMSSANEQERQRADQGITEARTEEFFKTMLPETDWKTISDDRTAPTKPLRESVSDSGIHEPPVTDSLRFETSATQPTGGISKPELTGTPHFDADLLDAKNPLEETAPLTFVDSMSGSKSNFKYFWLLPVFALGLLMVGGIGGTAWIFRSDLSESPKPAANMIISMPDATPAEIPVVSPDILPTAEPTTDNTATTERRPNVVPLADQPPAPKQVQAPRPTPVSTPVTKSIPKPPKTPNLSDNCIYNGKCK